MASVTTTLAGFALQAQIVGITPPPPPAPPVPSSPVVRSALDRASRCVDGDPGEIDHDGRFAAERAVANLSAAPGSPEWTEASKVVRRYVEHRRQQAACLNELDRFRYAGAMSTSDRVIVTQRLQALSQSWYGQAFYEAAVLARLIGEPRPARNPPAPRP